MAFAHHLQGALATYGYFAVFLIVAMESALNNVMDNWKQPPAPVKKAADDLLAKVKAAAAVFRAEPRTDEGISELGGAGAPLPYVAPPVTQKITGLLAQVAGYPSAPTSFQMGQMELCAAELKAAVAGVNKLDGELPRLNKMMLDSGMPYITIDPGSVPPDTGGRRGGGGAGDMERGGRR